jgi:hypothetical protein
MKKKSGNPRFLEGCPLWSKAMNEFVFHRITSIGALDDCILCAQFEEGVIKTYDIKKLFHKVPAFRVFETKPELFFSVHVDTGGYGIVWNNELDLDSNEIWHNGQTENSPFNNLISFGTATSQWGLSESTLRKAISYRKLIPGRDCCKFGKQWVITREAMLREYGQPQIPTDKNHLSAAEKEYP